MSVMIYHSLVCVFGRGDVGTANPTKLLLTRVRPQNISGYASLTPCHWSTEAAYSLGLLVPFSAGFSLC